MAGLSARLEVQQRLLAWYASEARDLPWRRTRDPYAILVAEVMLQQTGVDRVIPKWHAWLEQFPTLQALADASGADAIRAWQGLGYNMRALRLHGIARAVVADFGGQLPCDLTGLMRLKGIGRYTAGAVACFAYEMRVAMVDTNVRRVLSRVFGVDQSAVDRLADEIVPATQAYPWNQALMDLGATVCKARKPACLVCPLLGACRGPSAPLPKSQNLQAVEPFEQSSRYFRGRVIDALRALPKNSAMPLGDLVAHVKRSEAPERIEALVRGLARDGLVTLEQDMTVRLPNI
ncbi:MAG: A/G-specific adenine glycosylase [Chloroflexota bacterium]